MIGVLLPTRGRYEALERCLDSLANSDGAEYMEIVVIADQDRKSFNIVRGFLHKKEFGGFGRLRVHLSKDRMYSVKAFNKALEMCESNIFTWINDECTFEEWWLGNLYKTFIKTFSDHIGVVNAGHKRTKVGFGMTSRKFIEHNNGEWFHPGYSMFYADDELACRAVLLGRYEFLKDNGIYHDQEVLNNIPILSWEERQQKMVDDRGIFRQRLSRNFDLDPNKICRWEGFRDINEPLIN